MKYLIFGITGQDGTIMSEILAREEKNKIYGFCRNNKSLIKCSVQELLYGDITSYETVNNAIKKIRPDIIFNFSGQSSVNLSEINPIYTNEVNAIGAINIFESVYQLGLDCKVLQMSSVEMFGANKKGEVWNEDTPHNPVNPYGASKSLAHNMAKIYRQKGAWIANAICSNHESQYRPLEYFITKVAYAAAKGQPVSLGNLQPVRDFGYAPEFMKSVLAMTNLSDPEDILLATGVSVELQTFVMACYLFAGYSWKDFVTIDSSLLRPNESGGFYLDVTKGRTLLGEENMPKSTWEDLAKILINYYR